MTYQEKSQNSVGTQTSKHDPSALKKAGDTITQLRVVRRYYEPIRCFPAMLNDSIG